MTYELAKKLNEAGFPQRTDGEGNCQDRVVCCIHSKSGLMSPTLSELVTACGDMSLSHTVYENDGTEKEGRMSWVAYGIGIEEIGFTPEEAVAKLWLELQK
jgi:hypothetical protein